MVLGLLLSHSFHFFQVNNKGMVNATHAEAVAALKSVTDRCSMMVSREVLVVLPDDIQLGSGESIICVLHVCAVYWLNR